MDKRFDITYAAKLQLHREEMQKRREEKLERMQMQALQEQERSQQMQMIYLNGSPDQQRQLIFFEHFPPHQIFVLPQTSDSRTHSISADYTQANESDILQTQQ